MKTLFFIFALACSSAPKTKTAPTVKRAAVVRQFGKWCITKHPDGTAARVLCSEVQ